MKSEMAAFFCAMCGTFIVGFFALIIYIPLRWARDCEDYDIREGDREVVPR
jgi:hypothetical protein